MKKTFLTIAVLLIALLSASGTLGQQLKDLQEDLQTVKRAQAAREKRVLALQAELKNLNAQEQNLVADINALNTSIGKLEGKRQSVQQQVESTQVQVTTVEGEVQRLEDKVQTQSQSVQRLVRLVDRERSSRLVRLLSRSQSVYEALVKARDVNTLGVQDIGVIEALQKSVGELGVQRDKYLVQVQNLNAFQVSLSKRQNELNDARNVLSDKVTALQQTQAGRKALLLETLEAQARGETQINILVSNIVEERARLEDLRRQKIEEERRKRAEEARRIQEIKDEKIRVAAQKREQSRQQQASSTLPPEPARLPSSVGRLSNPIAGGEIIRDYGEAGDYVVIRGPAPGSPVLAAADGLVIVSQLLQANDGYMVAIQHTSGSAGITTVYTNLDAGLAVRVGQRVNRGQLIGYTGGGYLYPTDQVHFKVAVGRSSANPSRYLR